jgi:hypothetical protein
LFEALLRIFPMHFRREFGEGMRETFAEQYAEYASAGRGSLLGFLYRTAIDMSASGLQERLRPSVPLDRSSSRLGGALAQDLKFSVRTLWRTPAFSGAVFVTLGGGSGGAGAVFGVVGGVVLGLRA